MSNERAEAHALATEAARGEAVWPSFVSDAHLDRADREFIGSFETWLASHPRC